MNDRKPEFALKFGMNQDPYGDGSGHPLLALFVQVVEVRPASDSSTNERSIGWKVYSHEADFAGLVMRGRLYGADPHWGVVSDGPVMSGDYSDGLSLDECERGVKVLRRVARYNEKVADEMGRAASFGERVARMANALGIKKVLIERVRPCQYGDDLGNQYHELKPGEARGMVDERVASWAKEKGLVPAAA